jgi:hypothetical protein
MPLRENQTDDEQPDIDQEECDEQHVTDLDDGSKRFLSMFSTIRSKVDDLARAQSDAQRFELSIEVERKKFQKRVEDSKLALRNARVQIGVELAKVDEIGFSKILELIKGDNAAK